MAKNFRKGINKMTWNVDDSKMSFDRPSVEFYSWYVITRFSTVMLCNGRDGRTLTIINIKCRTSSLASHATLVPIYWRVYNIQVYTLYRWACKQVCPWRLWTPPSIRMRRGGRGRHAVQIMKHNVRHWRWRQWRDIAVPAGLFGHRE